ncbi:FecR family protein [Sinorhizobium sp. BG8]|uniref:FecR family protein n=1 Tax=Sinorhizobium sp. BG8 TaxID=2613773 RepID=UPI00193DFA15|nr:FecR family protein [Sinorhizobium sp. BG8]QRM56133.1 FecR family protein [Sinorhizobium sp. BG8]
MADARNQSLEEQREQALAWFVRMQSGDATDADRAGHAAWMAQSAENRAAYARLTSLWTDLDGVTDRRTQAICLPARSTRGMGRRAFLVGGAAALGVAGLVAGAGLPDFWLSDYATGTGQQQSIALSDGSTVGLDADTAIAVEFTDSSRRISLLHGRAFFDVAKNDRPFVVEAANGTTTALGTRFVVHQWFDMVTVSVEESAVSVMAPNRTIASLHVGQNVSYGEDGLGAVGGIDVELVSAWRRGKLIFEDRPLRQVIADVNRYRSGTIRITDSRLLNLRVSGIFDIRNPDGVLDAIAEALPVRVTRLTDFLVLVRPA